MRSLQLMLDFLSTKENPECERVIIGAGVAGTGVCAEIPADLRHKKTAYHLPAIFVLNDSDHNHQWQKDGCVLAGQPARVQSPHSFTSRSEDYAKEADKKRNPYDFVMSDDLAHSIVETQNHLNMHVLNLKAVKIESRDEVSKQGLEQQDKSDPWEHPKSIRQHQCKATR